MRKLATIRKIDSIHPIEGADNIECAKVGGWSVVVRKRDFEVGELVVYIEIDSWVPHHVAPFLSKDKTPREFMGHGPGERLRTIVLRGQISQGLVLDLYSACMYDTRTDESRITPDQFVEGLDVTELLGIVLWTPSLTAQLSGVAKGNYPSSIPRSNQERAQNLSKEIFEAKDTLFEITEKLEGSAATCYLINGVFGVCSHNIDLMESVGNTFWDTVRANDIESKMRCCRHVNPSDWAIQGELVGPGIQSNIYKLAKHAFYVYDIYHIKSGKFLKPEYRRMVIESMGLDHVPIILMNEDLHPGTVSQLLLLAEGKSALNDKQEREGLVFKACDGSLNFKVVSNSYLLKEKELK